MEAVEVMDETSFELRYKMAEMTVESRKTSAELQLQKDKMAALERDNAGPSFLQRLTSGFLNPFQAPKEVPYDELRRFQQYEVNVTLDPDTAHPKLILSEDGKQVSHGDVWKNLPDNTKRFSPVINVLGKQGFSSGRFYYEVQVGGKTVWMLGVASESIDRKSMIKRRPSNGYWNIWLRNGNEYGAADAPRVLLPVKGKVQKVGVFVDYEEGLVSFYDVEARVHLYSFTGCFFTEKLFPFFSPHFNDGGTNSAPLIIHTPSMH